MKKQIATKLSKSITSMALSMGKANVNSACFGWFHQPRIPAAMDKFRK